MRAVAARRTPGLSAKSERSVYLLLVIAKRVAPSTDCGSRYSTGARRDTRPVDSVWRHLDLGTWRLEIHARRRRLCCPEHGVRAEEVPFACHRSQFTHDFERDCLGGPEQLPEHGLGPSKDPALRLDLRRCRLARRPAGSRAGNSGHPHHLRSSTNQHRARARAQAGFARGMTAPRSLPTPLRPGLHARSLGPPANRRG